MNAQQKEMQAEIRTTGRKDSLVSKNKATGKADVIKQYNLEMRDWGIHFYVDTELDAYKAAYQYRNVPHGTIVNYVVTADMWLVTVFNDKAKGMGIDGAR